MFSNQSEYLAHQAVQYTRSVSCSMSAKAERAVSCRKSKHSSPSTHSSTPVVGFTRDLNTDEDIARRADAHKPLATTGKLLLIQHPTTVYSLQNQTCPHYQIYLPKKRFTNIRRFKNFTLGCLCLCCT